MRHQCPIQCNLNMADLPNRRMVILDLQAPMDILMDLNSMSLSDISLLVRKVCNVNKAKIDQI